jgi:flavin reductase ActVB
MSLDAAAFRRTMSTLAAGVTVITARDAGGAGPGRGRARGMTATSVTSLSLEPPLLLVCVGHDAELHDIIVRASHFGVLMLAADQEQLAVRFATRGRQQFEEGPRTTPAGLPCPAGVLAAVDCRRRAVLEGGDHSIVVGELEWSELHDAEPLLYFRSRYIALRP